MKLSGYYQLMYKDRKGPATLLDEKYERKEDADDRMRRIISAQSGDNHFNPGICFSWFGPGDLIECWRVFNYPEESGWTS